LSWAGHRRGTDQASRPPPAGWDLNLVRGDLDDTTVSALERHFPGLGSRLAVAAEPGAAGRSSKV
jgi:hypothetical protein